MVAVTRVVFGGDSHALVAIDSEGESRLCFRQSNLRQRHVLEIHALPSQLGRRLCKSLNPFNSRSKPRKRKSQAAPLHARAIRAYFSH